jgi:hypothetical protein
MRSFLLLLIGLFVAALGFTVYWMIAGAAHSGGGQIVQKNGPAPTSLPTKDAALPGNDVWYLRLDPKTGTLTSRFKAATYERAKDGRWFVTRPQAEFFVAQGRVIHLQGVTGYITTEEALHGRSATPGTESLAQSPRSGELRDVVVQRFPSLQVANHHTDKDSDLTLTTPCASFDNETFRIQTEPYTTPDGKHVRAEDVPVNIRGDQYEFDGFGLNLQYDELEQRIEYLKIFKGQRLLIKDPKFMKVQPMPQGGAAEPAASLPSSILHPPSSPPTPDLLAAADNSVLAQANPAPPARRPGPAGAGRGAKPAPATQPKTHVVEQPVYRATFHKNVEVFQGTAKVAIADEMQVEFISENNEMNPMASPATQPAAASQAQPATRPVRAGNSTPRTPRLASTRPDNTHPLGHSSTQPAVATTQPAKEPITILWTGPLVMIPLNGDRPDRIAPGESIVKLIGNKAHPAEVYRDSMRGNEKITNTIRCGALTHWTMTQDALLEEAKDLPVEMFDSRGDHGAHVVTHHMLFNKAEKNAVLTGQSSARLPLEQAGEDPSKPSKTELMTVTWLDRCTLEFEGEADDMLVKQSRLEGDVHVDHPQLKMDSRYLDLFFNNDAPVPTTRPASTQPSHASSPQLEQLRASGMVHCVVNGPGGPQDLRKLDCDDLRMGTAHGADGRLFARNILATGSVHAIDPQRDLHAGYLNVILAEPTTKPSTRPSTQPALANKGQITPGELKSLLAHDAVHVVTADGKTADADEMRINVANGETLVTLTGAPAKVTRGPDVLTGPFITMVPETEHLTVTGKGEMHGIQQAAGDKPARPFDVAWQRTLDGLGDTIEATGDVVAKSIDSDGALNTAKGDRIIITTTTRPSTRPSTQPALAGSTTQPAVAGAKKKSTTQPAGDLDAMGDREVKSITLKGNAITDSILNDDKGNLLRMMQVKSEVIQFFQLDPLHKKLVIPGAGTMLFVDNRPPAADKPAQEAAKDPMGMRGQTAFGWEESLVYDETINQMTMLGSVVIGRKDQNAAAGSKPMQIFGDKVVADIEPAKEPTTRPATKPATKPSTRPASGLDFTAKLQLKNVHIEGDPLRVQSDQLDLRAQTMDYDPAKHLLTALGQGRKRVQQLGPNGLPMATFEKFVWDTDKAMIVESTKGTLDRSK